MATVEELDARVSKLETENKAVLDALAKVGASTGINWSKYAAWLPSLKSVLVFLAGAGIGGGGGYTLGPAKTVEVPGPERVIIQQTPAKVEAGGVRDGVAPTAYPEKR